MEKDKSKEFENILKKTTSPTPSLDLTNLIMGKIKLIDAKNALYKKYIKKSWFFIIVAVILSLKMAMQLSYFELALADIVNSYLPGSSQIFTFTLLSLIASLVFYQFNSLLNIKLVKDEV